MKRLPKWSRRCLRYWKRGYALNTLELHSTNWLIATACVIWWHIPVWKRWLGISVRYDAKSQSGFEAIIALIAAYLGAMGAGIAVLNDSPKAAPNFLVTGALVFLFLLGCMVGIIRARTPSRRLYFDRATRTFCWWSVALLFLLGVVYLDAASKGRLPLQTPEVTRQLFPEVEPRQFKTKDLGALATVIVDQKTFNGRLPSQLTLKVELPRRLNDWYIPLVRVYERPLHPGATGEKPQWAEIDTGWSYEYPDPRTPPGPRLFFFHKTEPFVEYKVEFYIIHRVARGTTAVAGVAAPTAIADQTHLLKELAGGKGLQVSAIYETNE